MSALLDAEDAVHRARYLLVALGLAGSGLRGDDGNAIAQLAEEITRHLEEALELLKGARQPGAQAEPAA